MYDRAAMVRRSRGRYLAPIALAATITGTYLVVHNGIDPQVVHDALARLQPARRPPEHGKFDHAKFYVVKPGDTLSSISQKTGVSIETLESLNHKLDRPQQPAHRAAAEAATVRSRP